MHNTYVLLISIFENAKKSYWLSKTPFLQFLAVNNGFLCILNNTDQNNICASIVFNPLTMKNEKFADFRETSTACSSWYAEFRTFRIFEISLSIQKLCKNFSFPVFLTVRAYLKSYFYQNYSAYRTFYAESRSVGIFEISFTVQKL